MAKIKISVCIAFVLCFHTISYAETSTGTSADGAVKSGDNTLVEKVNDPIRGFGRIFVDGNFPEAVVSLDGKELGQKAGTILSNITPGKHTVMVRKGDTALVRTLELEANETRRLDFRFPEIDSVLIRSNPAGADVWIDQEYEGATPVTVETTIGTHRLEIELEGFEQIGRYEQEIEVKSFEENIVDVELERLSYLEITVSPPDAQVEIDGDLVSENDTASTYDTVHDTTEFSLYRTKGDHYISVSHPGAEDSWEADVNLNAEKPHLQDISLEIREDYLDQLKYESEMSRYRTCWWIRYSSLFIGAVFAGYSYQESQNALAAQESKESQESLMLSAASKRQSLVYYEQSFGHAETIKESNRNMINSALLSTLFLGIAFWSGMDEPEKPENVSFLPLIDSNNAFSVSVTTNW